MTAPNQTGKTAPSKRITGKHANQIGALQTIAECATNVAFAK